MSDGVLNPNGCPYIELEAFSVVRESLNENWCLGVAGDEIQAEGGDEEGEI